MVRAGVKVGENAILAAKSIAGNDTPPITLLPARRRSR